MTKVAERIPKRCNACGKVVLFVDPFWSWNREVEEFREATREHLLNCEAYLKLG
jgi:tRNA G26 N,N-dimethylase Trm1